MKLSFHDIFDLEEIQKLQDGFSKATGLASIISDPEGVPITAQTGFTPLCRMIRNSEIGAENCICSDSIIGKPKKDGPRIHVCQSGGLLDAGASIMVGDIHIASWLAGQVLDSDINIEKMLKYADLLGVDKEEYKKALEKIPKMSREQFENIAQFLYNNAKLLSNLAFQNAEQKLEIERRKEVEKRLEAEKGLFEVTIQSIGDGIITTDTYGKVTTMNTVAESITGWEKNEVIGLPIEKVFNIYYEKSGKHYSNPVYKALKTGNTINLDENVVLKRKDHIKVNISDSVAPIKDHKGEIHGAVLVFRDVSLEKKHKDEIIRIGYHDKLTGLYNRAYFEKEIKRSKYKKIMPLSIIIGDVNGLKLVNDLFGHQEGDRLLKAISKILLSCCRPYDIITRLGGDEFAILLPNTDYETGQKICNAIKKKCNQKHGLIFQPSIALGLDSKTEVEEEIILLTKRAEDRMYRNKLMEDKSKKSGIVLSLQRTLYEKSFETKEHASRLVEYAFMIGEKIGLHRDEIDDLKLAASLHDIGKVAISDTILTKPGKLTNEEWEEMKRHTEVGYRIVLSSPELSHITEYILCHHERWDGHGYPQRRGREEIPLISRIISVVDSYDVMVSLRPYKEKMSSDEALNELKRCSGTQFDPNIVSIFVDLMVDK